MIGAAETRGEIVGKRDLGEDRRPSCSDVLPKTIFEELAGIVANGRRRERDADVEDILGDGVDRDDAAEDFLAHKGVGDDRRRHLDALLDGDRLGPRRNRGAGQRTR